MIWCVLPIRWAQKWLLPPESADWQRISFQPMLYLATFIATILIVIQGSPLNVSSQDFVHELGLAFWVWCVLGLTAPVAALGSLWLVNNATGRWRYRGLWTRLGADIAQLVAMVIYTWFRIDSADYHVYPVACLLATNVFVGHLILRDARRLHEVESLAHKIRRGEVRQLHASH